MKLKYQWPFVWSLVLLLPFSDSLSLPATGGTIWHHLLWPLVHANIFHWFINTFCFMALWRFITLSRLLWAYAASILIGYLWCTILNSQWSTFNVQCSMFNETNSSLFTLSYSLKLCGLSSILFFLLGTIFVRARKRYRLRLALLIIISCFIPNIAASVHIASLIAGILYSRCAHHISGRVSRGPRYIFYTVAVVSVSAGFASVMLNVKCSMLNVQWLTFPL